MGDSAAAEARTSSDPSGSDAGVCWARWPSQELLWNMVPTPRLGTYLHHLLSSPQPGWAGKCVSPTQMGKLGPLRHTV